MSNSVDLPLNLRFPFFSSFLFSFIALSKSFLIKQWKRVCLFVVWLHHSSVWSWLFFRKLYRYPNTCFKKNCILGNMPPTVLSKLLITLVTQSHYSLVLLVTVDDYRTEQVVRSRCSLPTLFSYQTIQFLDQWFKPSFQRLNFEIELN